MDGFAVGAAGAFDPLGEDIVAAGLVEGIFDFGGEFDIFHAAFGVFVDAFLGPDGFDPLAGGALMALAFLFNDGLEVGRDTFPDILVHSNPGYGDGDDGADHIVGYFVPADAGAASAAGDGGVQHAAFQGGIDIGECHKLGVGAHTVQQVAEDGAVAAGFQALKVGEGVEFFGGEVVVAFVVVLHYDDAVGLFLDDAVQVGAGGVDDGEVGIGVGEEAPEVGDVDDGEVAADVAGVDFGEFHSLVADEAEGVGAGEAQFGEGADLELDAAVGAVFDAFDEAVDAVFLLGGVDEGAGVAGAVDAHQLDIEYLVLRRPAGQRSKEHRAEQGGQQIPDAARSQQAADDIGTHICFLQAVSLGGRRRAGR